jgi:prevent-host-death family protein
METVNISDLRANLLNYLKKASEGQEILVTSHGEVLATIVPPVDKFKRARIKLNELAKTAVIHDVVSPTGEQWDALS